MNGIFLVEETTKLPLWGQNLFGIIFVGFVIFVSFFLIPWVERDSRKKYILRNAGILLTVMDKRADMAFFVKLYDMSVSEVLAVWFKLMYLVADHNKDFVCEPELAYRDDSKDPYALYRCLADQFNDVHFLRRFEQKKVEKFLHKHNFEEVQG